MKKLSRNARYVEFDQKRNEIIDKCKARLISLTLVYCSEARFLEKK